MAQTYVKACGLPLAFHFIHIAIRGGCTRSQLFSPQGMASEYGLRGSGLHAMAEIGLGLGMVAACAGRVAISLSAGAFSVVSQVGHNAWG